MWWCGWFDEAEVGFVGAAGLCRGSTRRPGATATAPRRCGALKRRLSQAGGARGHRPSRRCPWARFVGVGVVGALVHRGVEVVDANDDPSDPLGAGPLPPPPHRVDPGWSTDRRPD